MLSKHGYRTKNYITKLQLFFDEEEADQEWRKKQDEELVEALNVPPNLEFLFINCFMGLRPPKWLDSLTLVKDLHLYDCWYCEHLPNNLGKLPCLEALRLYGFASVKKVGAEFLGIDKVMLQSSSTIGPLFPKLKYLRLRYFNDWEEWDDVDGDVSVMPSLSYLDMEYCPKLKKWPNFLAKLICRGYVSLDIKSFGVF